MHGAQARPGTGVQGTDTGAQAKGAGMWKGLRQQGKGTGTEHRLIGTGASIGHAQRRAVLYCACPCCVRKACPHLWRTPTHMVCLAVHVQVRAQLPLGYCVHAHLVLLLEVVDAALLVADGLIALPDFPLERANVLFQRRDRGVQLPLLRAPQQRRRQQQQSCFGRCLFPGTR